MSVTIPGEPVGKGRPRAARMGAHVRMYTPHKTASWETDAAALMQRAWRQAPLDEPCRLSVIAVASRPKRLLRKRDPDGRIVRTSKPEGDNVLKCVGDALTKAGVVRDDSLIAEWHVLSLYAARDEGPRVEVVLVSMVTP